MELVVKVVITYLADGTHTGSIEGENNVLGEGGTGVVMVQQQV